jgi:hypothetical protein
MDDLLQDLQPGGLCFLCCLKGFNGGAAPLLPLESRQRSDGITVYRIT